MGKLISVATALASISDAAKPMGFESLALKELDGHVLAENALAKTTLPPLDASAMDGYAVKLEDRHKQGSVFNQIGASPAGSPFAGTVGKDETVRIFTGGAVPDGANHVIMQENVSAEGDKVTLVEPIFPASHIRKAGIDFTEGQLVVNAGAKLDAYAIALLAAANHGTVSVRKRPKVALIANGDELLEPGSKLHKGAVVSSNPSGLAPLITSWGAEPIFAGISSDNPQAIKAQIAACADADILVPIGGASVGDHDYMRPVFTELGYKKVFEKVAVKPGKPVWFGTIPRESSPQYVLGLPGNPASALVTAHIFLKALIDGLIQVNDPSHKFIPAHVTHPMKAATWRAEYIRATAKIDGNGTVQVTAIPRQDSSLLTPFLKANCFLVRDPDAPALAAGGLAKIMLIKQLG